MVSSVQFLKYLFDHYSAFFMFCATAAHKLNLPVALMLV